MTDLKKQKKLIEKKDWDCLIVLDACRYDYFEGIYGNYLNGELKKAQSSGSGTAEWLKNTFEERKWDDTVYISANPFVNSKGIDLAGGFVGTDYFYKVIDAWDYGWNNELNTVPPGETGRFTRIARAKYPDKHLISHFMQPHYPFISLGPLTDGTYETLLRARKGIEGKKSLFKNIRGMLGNLAGKIIGKVRLHRIRKTFGFKKPGELELVENKYGRKKLLKAYEENLKLALKEIRKIVDRLPGKIIVTADHGESLGENGLYGHPSGYRVPTQLEVPWFE